MGTGRLILLIAASLIAGTGVMLMTGCGGDSGTNNLVRGGSLSGQTVDAASGVGLGGVLVSIGNWVMVNGQQEFVSAGSAYSTTPNGVYTIEDVLPGNYSVLRITPVEELFGPVRYVAVNITIAEDQKVVMGPLLIIDEFPPDPGL